MVTRVRSTFKRDGSLATQETETWDGDWRVSTEFVTFDGEPVRAKPMRDEHRRMVETRRRNQQAKREAQLNKYAANLS